MLADDELFDQLTEAFEAFCRLRIDALTRTGGIDVGIASVDINMAMRTMLDGPSGYGWTQNSPDDWAPSIMSVMFEPSKLARPLTAAIELWKPNAPLYFSKLSDSEHRALLSRFAELLVMIEPISSRGSRCLALSHIIRDYLRAFDGGAPREEGLVGWSKHSAPELVAYFPEVDGLESYLRSLQRSFLETCRAMSGDSAIDELAVAVLDMLDSTDIELDQIEPVLLPELAARLTQWLSRAEAERTGIVTQRHVSEGVSAQSAIYKWLMTHSEKLRRTYVDQRSNLTFTFQRFVDPHAGWAQPYVDFAALKRGWQAPTIQEYASKFESRAQKSMLRAAVAWVNDAVSLRGQPEAVEALKAAVPYLMETRTRTGPGIMLLVGPPSAGQARIQTLIGDLLRFPVTISTPVEVVNVDWQTLAAHSAFAAEKSTDPDTLYVYLIKGFPGSGTALETVDSRFRDRDRKQFFLIASTESEANYITSNLPSVNSDIIQIPFKDLSPTELGEEVRAQLEAAALVVDSDAWPEIDHKLQNATIRGNFRNLALVDLLVANIKRVVADTGRVTAELVDGIEKLRPDLATISQDEVNALATLDGLIGLDPVKSAVKELVAEARFRSLRQMEGLVTPVQSRHLIFSGNPGTAKTTVARLVGSVYGSLGVLSKGRFVEVSASDLTSRFAGGSAEKTVRVIEKALGGVLFIDEANLLADGQQDSEALGVLLRLMENYRDDLVVIAAGYPKDMATFLSSSPGMRSRFPRTIHFDDYSVDELMAIFMYFAEQNGFVVDETLQGRVRKELSGWSPAKRNGNAREVRNLFESLVRARALAVDSLTTEQVDLAQLQNLSVGDLGGSAAEQQEQKSVQLEDARRELDRLVGCKAIKEAVRAFTAQAVVARERQRRGLSLSEIPPHMIFRGNPGTAKTTVARIVGRIMTSLGLLSSGHVIEVGRSDMIGEGIGQTATKVRALLESSLGGVLFIDRAYSLVSKSPDGYGSEAIGTLVRGMEDHRRELVVIAAGYPEPMDRFLESNPGFASRFGLDLTFADYSDAELGDIFALMADNSSMTLAPDVIGEVVRHFAGVSRDVSFGNGRAARKVFESTVSNQSQRLAKRIEAGEAIGDEELQTIVSADLLMDRSASMPYRIPGYS